MVADGETGLLVPFDAGEVRDDPDALARRLAEAIERVVADPDARRAMGEAGRGRVEARFAWSAVTERVVETYERVCDGS